MMTTTTLLIGAVALAHPAGGAGIWAGFRGNKVPFGRSSPILTERAVVVTGSDEDSLHVVALDRETGGLRWSRQLERARTQRIHSGNDSAAPTPVTDGENVFVFFPELGLVSLDEQGGERWRHPLGPFVNHYGMSGSPVLGGDTLVQVCDQQVGSFLLAVDAATGDERWRVERGVVEAFTTPVLHPADAPEQVIVAGSFHVHGYSLETGEELWSLGGFAYSPMPSPTVVGDTLCVCSPRPPEFPMPAWEDLLAQLDADGSGALTNGEFAPSYLHFGWLDADDDAVRREEYEFTRRSMRLRDFGLVAVDLAADEGPIERWRVSKGLPLISSPLVHDGLVYLARDGGVLTVLDAADGEVVGRLRLPLGPSECFPSPVAADGKVVVVSNAGTVTVLRAGADWSVLASNDLGEECFASPAVGGDSLFLRTAKGVYRFAEGR